MVYQKISDDLKEAALWLMACGHDTVYDIAAVTGFFVHTLYCAHHQKLHTGSIAEAEDIGHGWPRTLARRDCDYLLRPVLITPPHIPTGFLQFFQKGIFICFYILLLPDSYWIPTGVSYNLLLQMP